MDSLSGDFTLQDVLGRGGDFVGGIDNEALDFSQLEAFINSDASQNNGNYFGESLGTPSSGKLLNVIVEPKRPTGHSLPDSPPDSSSEHPYSPQENCESNMNTTENIYTSLGQQIYKPTLLNPILTDNLIIGSHIVVSEPNTESHLLENGNILQDNRLLDTEDLRNSTNILNESNRQLLIGATTNENSQNFVETCQRNDNLLRRNTNELLLVKNAEFRRDLEERTRALFAEPIESAVQFSGGFEEHCSPSQLSPPSNLTSPLDDEYSASEGCLGETQYQCIRFTAFQQTAWHALCDQNLSELPVPHYRVDADKGFNFSNADDAFVCQKKNHFQITCHVQLLGDAQFVKTAEGFQKISSFHLHFYGVKHDCPTQTIRVEQSQSDRSKKPFHPVLVELVNSQVTKVTVGRLHFSETTSNNMRKKGKPNPEQRYFQLVVGLHAHTTHGNFPVISHASQKIIVRASNPGQFENDVELCWQKGQTQDSIFHAGKVGINTDRPDESLVVHGNLKITGHIIQPSDIRAKKNIVECDTKEQLRNVQRLRVVRYEYEPEFASQLRRPVDIGDTGVIAQEVAEILPEAAGSRRNSTGSLVNKERIFIENIGAVKELCKVTDNLETRIDQLERINRRLNKLKRGDSLKSTSTVNSVKHVHTKKCFKHHSCTEDSELCSTKFIQVIIIVLVLIMAFCLAAITTLYLIDASRHRSLDRTNYQYKQNFLSTNAPTKLSKIRTWPTVHSRISTIAPYKEPGITRPSIEVASINKEFSHILGRPSDCLSEQPSYDSTNACQIYCCGSLLYEKPNIIGVPVFKEKIPKISHPKNKTVSIALLDKNKMVKSLSNNNIDKHPRQKRENDDINDKDNSFDAGDDHHLRISIQGKNFSTDLGTDYLVESRSSPANYTYNIPISKYMPDPFIRVVFRSHQKNIIVEHCSNTRVHPCPFVGLAYTDENKTQPAYKVNENIPLQPINYHTFIFEVDMMDYQSKIMTYRYTYRQNQNTCKISSSKLGVEFTEYNFIFYRHCDE
ncbi:NDT80 / PhoG like DNA-binding family [Popillia japonica]|uniref:Myelin regulatory factor n=1 Tax=Popillia japonica TaxID=7064 RepID=A0AAW1MLD9_POPJA